MVAPLSTCTHTQSPRSSCSGMLCPSSRAQVLAQLHARGIPYVHHPAPNTHHCVATLPPAASAGQRLHRHSCYPTTVVGWAEVIAAHHGSHDNVRTGSWVISRLSSLGISPRALQGPHAQLSTAAGGGLCCSRRSQGECYQHPPLLTGKLLACEYLKHSPS